MGAIAASVALSVFSSAIYDFLKYGLTKNAPERDFFEKSLKKCFREVRDHLARTELGVWSKLTVEVSNILQNRLIECLHSPDIDRDEFIRILREVLKKEGLGKEEAEKFYSMVFDGFVAIVDEEASKNPKVFRAVVLNACKEHGVRLEEIATYLVSIRNDIPNIVRLVLAIKSQLDRMEATERRIEERITRIDEERRVIVPTIQSVLRKKHPDPQLSKGMFFRKEPAWVDFEEGFIFERKEVNEVIERLKKCNVHLVVGEPAAGKSVVLKNVGFKLAKRNLHVYYVGLKTYSDKLRPCFEQILRMKKEQAVLIIDDAHLQPSACEELIRELYSAKSKIKVLIGSRPIDEVVRKSPRESSEFEYLSKTKLNAEDISRGIIDLFLRKRHNFSKGRIARVSKRLSEYGYDLWVLSWALEAFDPESDSVYEEWIIEKMRDSIRELGQGADDALFPISVFYLYEIPFDRSYLTQKIGLEERVINRLVEQSEIIQIEYVQERQSLCLAHSSIANLYFKTYQNYPSLGENARRCFQGDDAEYEVFCRYMLELDPTYTLDIVNSLARASEREQNRRLLLKLLENKEIEDQIRKGIDKEKDLDKIVRLMRDVELQCILSYARELGPKLFTCVYHEGFKDAVLPKLASETDLGEIYDFFRRLQWIRFMHLPYRGVSMPGWRFGRILIESLDLGNLSSKVALALKEGDTKTAFDTIYIVTRIHKFAGLFLAERTDFSKVKDRNDLKNLLCLWDYRFSLVVRERLRQIILKSNPNLKENMDEVPREEEEG